MKFFEKNGNSYRHETTPKMRDTAVIEKYSCAISQPKPTSIQNLMTKMFIVHKNEGAETENLQKKTNHEVKMPLLGNCLVILSNS